MATAIQPEWSMEAILRARPAARRALFRNYHIGGCSSCAFQPTETLAEVCRRNEDLDPSVVIDVIETAQEEESKLQVAPEVLKGRLDAGETIRLIDIRSRQEYEAVALPGSCLLTEEVSRELMRDKGRAAADVVPTVMIDHEGKHVMDAVSYFLGHGVPEVYALDGGIDAWADRMDPVMPRYRIE